MVTPKECLVYFQTLFHCSTTYYRPKWQGSYDVAPNANDLLNGLLLHVYLGGLDKIILFQHEIGYDLLTDSYIYKFMINHNTSDLSKAVWVRNEDCTKLIERFNELVQEIIEEDV